MSDEIAPAVGMFGLALLAVLGINPKRVADLTIRVFAGPPVGLEATVDRYVDYPPPEFVRLQREYYTAEATPGWTFNALQEIRGGESTGDSIEITAHIDDAAMLDGAPLTWSQANRVVGALGGCSLGVPVVEEPRPLASAVSPLLPEVPDAV